MKMRRIVALVMVLAMMLCVLPGASAEALSQERMPQMKSIDYDEYLRGYTFSEFDDLQQIITTAKNDPYEYYEYYSAESVQEFVFSKNIEIPENLNLIIMADVVIPADVTVTLNGYLSTYCLDVQGHLKINETGYLYPRSSSSITGALDLYGVLSMSQYLTIDGIEKINYFDNGYVAVRCYFVNSDQMIEVAQEAIGNKLPWVYSLVPDERTIDVKDPIELPKNVNMDLSFDNLSITGAPITINGNLYIDTSTSVEIQNDLTLNGGCGIYTYEEYGNAKIVFGGSITNNGYMDINAPVVFEGGVTNLGSIDVWYDYNGSLTFEKPELYADKDGVIWGEIYVYSNEGVFPDEAIAGLSVNSFEEIEYFTEWHIPCWKLSGYREVEKQPSHVHTLVEDPAVAPSCVEYGKTAGSHCSDCGEVIVEQEKLAPLGHDYGLAEDGNPDFWDTTCDVCGAERVVDKHRPTHSMYRMYNPNSGEHFYTGSMEERQNLVSEGWKYEGVGFTFPASTGKPVYRLYDKFGTFEHLYTMDEAEKEKLLAKGWVLEGIAFNSGREDEVPQYRLHNPNATIGAYHFTASVEEKNMLIAAGWEYQGIGFYTCLQ